METPRCATHLSGMIIYLSLLIAVIGILVYALSANPKFQEIGRLAYGCGLLSFLLCVCHGMVNVLAK